MTKADAICALLARPDDPGMKRSHTLRVEGKPDRFTAYGDLATQFVQIQLVRRVNEQCVATIGQVGNVEHEKIVLGKAGRARHRGVRPITRGMARNPVDHPNGGGQGKSKGGGGWQQLTSPWGILAKGYKTRRRFKPSDRFIVLRRDGRPPKIK